MNKKGVLLSVARVFILLIALLGLVIFGLSCYDYIAFDSPIEATAYSFEKIEKNDFVKVNMNKIVGYYEGSRYINEASEKVKFRGDDYSVLTVAIGNDQNHYMRLYVPSDKYDQIKALKDEAGQSVSFEGRVVKAEEECDYAFYMKSLKLENEYAVKTVVSPEYALVVMTQDDYALGMEVGGLVFIFSVILIFCLSKVKKLKYK